MMKETTELDIETAAPVTDRLLSQYANDAVRQRFNREIGAALVAMRERCAVIADNYGREGDRLSKEFACEVADEIAARIRADTPQRTDPLHIIVAAMWDEYNMDQACDYTKINLMIEEAASIVGNRIGGRDRLDDLADSYTPNAMWDLL